jgi:hypothetical protein
MLFLCNWNVLSIIDMELAIIALLYVKLYHKEHKSLYKYFYSSLILLMFS